MKSIRQYFRTTSAPISASRYSIYYPDANGCLYVKPLGHGVQGSATLVWSVETGRYLVYKKAAVDDLYHQNPDDPEDSPEVRNWLPHPRIPELVQYKLCPQSLNYGRSSMIIVSEYCNGGDLSRYFQEFSCHSPEQFPEVLLWRLLSQLLHALDNLHRRSIIHQDILPCNVFINWREDQRLPDFYLGDFGQANDFDLTPRRDGTICEYERYTGAHGIAKDFSKVASLIRYLTVGDSSDSDSSGNCSGDEYAFEANDRWKAYSEELHSCYYNIMAFVQGVRGSPDWDPRDYNISRLRAEVDAMAKELEAEYLCAYPGSWERTKAEVEPRGPLVFDTPEAIMQLRHLPPGPWHIALLDPVSLNVLAIDPEEQCRYLSGRFGEW